MIRFLRHFRAALIFARTYHYVPQVDEIPWTDADSVTVFRFFSHGTGARLLLRLETGVVNMALEAAQKGNIHACGVANGASMQLAAIRNHFPQGMANNADTEETDAQAALDNFASETA